MVRNPLMEGVWKMGKKSELTPAERREVVLRALRREDTLAQIAREAGVSENTLCRWRDEFLAGGEAALSGRCAKEDPRTKRIKELEKQLAERDQVIGEITIANRILKKTADGRI